MHIVGSKLRERTEAQCRFSKVGGKDILLDSMSLTLNKAFSYYTNVQICPLWPNTNLCKPVTNFWQSLSLKEIWFKEILHFLQPDILTSSIFHQQTTSCQKRRRRITRYLKLNPSLSVPKMLCQSLQQNGMH